MERFSARAAKQASGATDSLVDWIDVAASGHRLWPDALPADVVELTRESERGFGGVGVGMPGAHFMVPVGRLLRDLNVGTPSAGGNLVGAPVAHHTPSLKGFSVVADAGAKVITLEAGEAHVGVPVTTSPPVATVAPVDGAVGESEPVISLRKNAPVTIGFWFKVTRRLLKQGGPAADRLMRTEIAQGIGRGIDRLALQGSGDPAQPVGLLAAATDFLDQPSGSVASGVLLYDYGGTTLSDSAMQGIIFDLRSRGDLRAETIGFVGSADTAAKLMARPWTHSSNPIWANERVLGFPAFVSAECPDGMLFGGDWSQLCVVLQGGLSIQVDPMGQVDGSVRVVVMTSVDVFPLRASSFLIRTGFE